MDDVLKKQIVNDVTKQSDMAGIPTHLHNGIDSLRIPAEYTALQQYSVTTASTAPTDTPDDGAIRILYNATSWYLWTRVNKLWKGIAIGGSALSHVSASRSTAQAVSSGDTLVFTAEAYDTLSEYNTGTGVFTAQNAGYYSVTALVTSASLAWAANNYWAVEIMVNAGATSFVVETLDAAVTGTKFAMATRTVLLAVGDTVEIKVLHDLGGAKNTRNDATRVYLNIDRIA